MDHWYGNWKAAYNLRWCNQREYSHLHTILESTMMTQYNMKKVIQMFGDAGVEAIHKELYQLHNCGVVELADQAQWPQ